MNWIKSLNWIIIFILVATLGLAPFNPEPHVVEKLTMLFNGTLAKPIDIFDLFLHATPWILLFLKIITLFVKTDTQNQ